MNAQAQMIWPDASSDEWNDWRWQMRNRVRDLRVLSRYLGRNLSQGGLEGIVRAWPMAITPHTVSHILELEGNGQHDSAAGVLKTYAPDLRELDIQKTIEIRKEGMGAAYRYPNCPAAIRQLYADRVIVMATFQCPAQCRHCFRRNDPGRNRDISSQDLQEAVQYIGQWNASNPDKPIREVIISGGDPLCLSDHKLRKLLEAVKNTGAVEVVRIDTKFPMALPQRITPELVEILAQHVHLVCLHAVHAGEISPETVEACRKLTQAGIILRSYTPLLRGINDSRETLKELFWQLYRNCRTMPYYLVHCIETHGAQHLKTPLEQGIEIMQGLRVELSGVCVPKYICYLPQGGGKAELGPDTKYTRTDDGYWLRSPITGETAPYPDPVKK